MQISSVAAELKAAYVIGAVHEAVFGELSPWSRLLTINDLRVLEYAADLKVASKSSFCIIIVHICRLNCVMLRHLVHW